MSQNSFIQQYLAKQQELLRQRLEREAREACDTNGKACFNLFAAVLTLYYFEMPVSNIFFFLVIEQQDHTEVNNSTSCPQVRHLTNCPRLPVLEFSFFSSIILYSVFSEF